MKSSEHREAVLEGGHDEEAWENVMPFCPGLVQAPDGSCILYHHSIKQRKRCGPLETSLLWSALLRLHHRANSPSAGL